MNCGILKDGGVWPAISTGDFPRYASTPREVKILIEDSDRQLTA